MDWLDEKPKTNSRNKRWMEFAETVNFKGMTLNNRKALEAIAESYKGGRCELTFRQIGTIMGCTKATAKNNMIKLADLGLVKMTKQYGGYNDRMPYFFSLNTRWRETS